MSLLERGRTHSCGELRPHHEGQTVALFGWVNLRRDLGGRIFVDLRDRDGVTQVVFGPDIDAGTHGRADALRREWCIGVSGKVISREGNVNANLATGGIEVEVSELEVFSESENPPFSIADDERLDTQEAVRLRYRYLDLRRASLQRNFVLRSKLANLTRRHLEEHGFLELETPCLVKYTPGGARNFLVPSRLEPGSFYALAESPQIFKQLFMVAGFDKYFQITRCFRDEDLRQDRQAEFTQIDVELSFATPERVFAPIETLMVRLWKDLLGVEITAPFERLTWDQAMGRWGCDKPDRRFGFELEDVSAVVRGSGFPPFEQAEVVKGLRVPAEHAQSLTRNQLDKLTEFVKKRESGGAKGLLWARAEEGGTFKSSFAKNLSPETMRALGEAMGTKPGDLLLLVADDFSTTNAALNALRLELRDSLGLLEKARLRDWDFHWVTDFPLFEKNDKGGFVSAHHPFTSPHLEHLDILTSDPARARARAYDLVLNGNEIGGGSIRIHRPDIQARVFAALGLSDEDARAKFGFLLDAFKYGPPPHGGIALGVDRLAMLMCGATSLRDVIAFPKTQKGQDLMTGAPTPADEPQLAELYLRHRPLPSSESGS